LGRGLGALFPGASPLSTPARPMAEHEAPPTAAPAYAQAAAPVAVPAPAPAPAPASAPAPAPASAPAAAQAAVDPRPSSQFFRAAVEDVYPAPEQPRKRFGEQELEELASSIRNHGIIQPLVVRARPEGGYFLIAGERRWRAAQRAGLTEVPVVVHQ